MHPFAVWQDSVRLHAVLAGASLWMRRIISVLGNWSRNGCGRRFFLIYGRKETTIFLKIKEAENVPCWMRMACAASREILRSKLSVILAGNILGWLIW